VDIFSYEPGCGASKAAIGTRIFTLPREVSNYREWFEKSADRVPPKALAVAQAIVINRMS
jgi:hypothetical protein